MAAVWRMRGLWRLVAAVRLVAAARLVAAVRLVAAARLVASARLVAAARLVAVVAVLESGRRKKEAPFKMAADAVTKGTAVTGVDMPGSMIRITCRMHFVAGEGGADCMVIRTDERADGSARYVLTWEPNVGVAVQRYLHLPASWYCRASRIASCTTLYLGSSLPAAVRGFLIPSSGQRYYTPCLTVFVHGLEYNHACIVMDSFRLSGTTSCFEGSDGMWVVWGVHSSMICALRYLLAEGGAAISPQHTAFLIVQTRAPGAICNSPMYLLDGYVQL